MKSFNCTYCEEKEPTKFYATHKTTCKNCQNVKRKIDRKTVKRTDKHARIYCKAAGLNLDTICDNIQKYKNMPVTKPEELVKIEESQRFSNFLNTRSEELLTRQKTERDVLSQKHKEEMSELIVKTLTDFKSPYITVDEAISNLADLSPDEGSNDTSSE